MRGSLSSALDLASDSIRFLAGSRLQFPPASSRILSASSKWPGAQLVVVCAGKITKLAHSNDHHHHHFPIKIISLHFYSTQSGAAPLCAVPLPDRHYCPRSCCTRPPPATGVKRLFVHRKQVARRAKRVDRILAQILFSLFKISSPPSPQCGAAMATQASGRGARGGPIHECRLSGAH